MVLIQDFYLLKSDLYQICYQVYLHLTFCHQWPGKRVRDMSSVFSVKKKRMH